tara:strand:- start:100 stop:378 length:279 start_codon:yes stop_codon:yes gene_type:complete
MIANNLNKTSNIIQFNKTANAIDLNKLPNIVEIPNVNLEVLSRKIEPKVQKKVCINKLNHKLLVIQKKNKLINTAIISSIFLTVGLIGFVAG